MTRVLFATNNNGKLRDAKRFSEKFDITLLSPKDLNLEIEVIEDGSTFMENADKKLYEFLSHTNDPTLWVIADDSGLEILALNNEPGVYSRRWIGHEMSDDELLDYCLLRMRDIDDRRARFRGVLSVGNKNSPVKHIEFKIDGELLDTPVKAAIEKGLPFRSIFYLPQYNRMLYEIHDTPYEKRKGLLTHREKALKEVFEYINSQTKDQL